MKDHKPSLLQPNQLQLRINRANHPRANIMGRYSFILLLFVPFNLIAQVFTPNPDWRFENFNGQNHFISREILDLTLDKHGYVWTCSGGVQRFDGYKTIDFNSFDQSKGGLKGNYTDVIADNSGRVWVSSSGLCYYDDATGKFVYVQSDKKHNITSVTAFVTQNNYLWFICEYGLAKLDLRTLKISFTSLKNITDPLVTFAIDDNTLLISSREKVYIYNIQKDTYTANTLIYKYALLKIFAVAKNGADVYIGTNYGLFTFNNLKDIVPLNAETKDISIADMLFLPQDKEKKYLFLATEGKGLMVYNIFLKKIEFTYLHDDNNLYSLPNNIVSKLYVDNKDRLWTCGVLGISMLDVSNQQLKMRFLTKSNIADLGVDKIAGDKYDSSRVWMSSYNRGMICVNWKTKAIEKIFNIGPEAQKLYDFTQLSKGKWLLATTRKIIEWGPQYGVSSQKELPVPDPLKLGYNIRGIIMASANTCFITTNKGLFKYDVTSRVISAVSENHASKNEADRLKYILLNGFYENGVVWAASRNGLFSYNVNTKQTIVYNGNGDKSAYYFFDIANAGNNQIVCASGSGIAIFNKQTKSFKVVSSIAGLYRPSCQNIISLNNMVWIGSEAGILNYNLNTNQSAKAGQETSIVPIFPSSPFTVIDNDIVFGFRNGYAYFRPGFKNNLLPTDPVIESISINNKPVSQLYPAAKSADEMVFTHSDNSVNIVFTAFLYSDPSHIKFRYRLKGANPNWQYAEEQRSANYAQLPPGGYTFYVQCGNNNGVWNSHLASFSFIIKPPYWETWWFRALIVLFIALILYRLYRYRIKNLMAIQKIRERIASDFHDDIGSALSSISIFSEVADKQLKQQAPPEQTREIVGHIALQSRAMLDAMDDIIWAVNPQNDHFNDLAVRMREFAIPLLELKDIRFDITIHEDILNTRLKMDVRKNIFMIFKECVNNILKHSGCTVMSVAVNKVNNQLELVISDNGCGFDMSVPTNRNGLKNMKKRAAEINGDIQVTTQKGEGTVTRLTVNII